MWNELYITLCRRLLVWHDAQRSLWLGRFTRAIKSRSDDQVRKMEAKRGLQ